nr:MAG TPA: putative membrane protein [Caudoviricetes sp.]
MSQRKTGQTRLPKQEERRHEIKELKHKIELNYSGPLPHPAIMEGYKNIDPSMPERIMQQFEYDAEHVREQEKAALIAEIADTRRSQWMAFAIAMFMMIIVLASLLLGNMTFAGISGLAFIAYIVMSFLRNK